jgi:hypothetical protein
MALEHGHRIINIDDKARHTIALAVNEPETIGVAAIRQSQAFPQLIGIGEFPLPEIVWRGLVAKMEYAGLYASVLVVRRTQQIAAMRQHRYPVAIGGLSFHPGHRARKYPGVEAEEGGLPLGLKADCFHGPKIEIGYGRKPFYENQGSLLFLQYDDANSK